MFRVIVRIILIVAFTTAIGVIGAAFWLLGFRDPAAWAAVAAALAVITSIISAWPAQRVLELQQDAQQPYPYPSIDLTSRYGLIQLRVTNYGGSAAHDICLHWHQPLLNSQGEEVKFTKQAGAPDISVLLPNESVNLSIDGSRQLFEAYEKLNYSGEVTFKDSSKRTIKYPFLLSAEKYRYTLSYSEEEPKTHYQLQKIPDELHKLRTEVNRLRVFIERTIETNSEE